VRFWNQLLAYAAGVNSGRARGFHTLDPVLNTIRTFNDGLYEGVEMGLSLRLPPGSDPGALRTAVLGLANGAPVSFPYLEHPFVAEKNTPLVRAFLRAIRTVGGQPRFKLKTGTSDMNVVGRAFGCPILAYGPGDSTLDHSPNEHIEIEEFRRGLDVLILALRNCGESVLAD
jgi:LysW-gamma-L-lysine carboxypeptidase